MPDRVETRLGTLPFTDGFPDDATVEKVFDNLDFQRGVQAFLTAMPAASLAASRKAPARLRSGQSDGDHLRVADGLAIAVLTANTESIYAMAWLDLKNGPIVVESPPNTLGLVDDFWFRYVTDLGHRRARQGQGRQVPVPAAGLHGHAAARATHVFKSRTFGNWFGTRGFQVNGDPKPGVDAIKQQLRIYPLARRREAAGDELRQRLGQGLQHDPRDGLLVLRGGERGRPGGADDAIDPETLGLLASIGIEKGKPFAPDARMKKILAEAAAVGRRRSARSPTGRRLKDAYFYPDSAWNTPFVGGSHEFLHHGARLLDARSYLLLLRHRHHAGDGHPEGRRRLGLRRRVRGRAEASRSTAARPTGCTCRPASRPSSSGRWCSTTPRRARCCRPTSRSRASAARRRASSINPDTSVDVYFGPTAAARQGEQLGADLARQGLDRHPPPLRPAAAVLRQDLAAGRDRRSDLSPARFAA